MLTKKQNYKYWAEWNKCKMAFIESGKTLKEANDMRYILHERALGYRASHTSMTNREFDLILSIFAVYSDPENALGIQIEKIDQPITRCKFLIDQLLNRLKVEEYGKDAYIEKMAMQICKKHSVDCEVADLVNIISALRYATGDAKRTKLQRKKRSDYRSNRVHDTELEPF